MALHQLGGPQLPIFQEFGQRVLAVLVTVAAKQFSGRRRRTRAGIEQGNIDFALRKRSVDKRQVADHRSKKTESKTSFGNHQRARQGGAGNDVAQAEREEGRAAEIDVRQETGLGTGHHHRGPRTILHEPESQHEADGPNPNKNEKRERSIKTQQSLAGLARRDESGHESPSDPRGTVEKASEPELSRDAAREDDGLKRVPKDDHEDRDTRGKGA